MQHRDRKRLIAAAAVLIGACLAILAPGAGAALSCTDNWTGTVGDGQWTTAGNWDGNHVPGSTDVACIPSNAGAVTISSSTSAIEAVEAQSSAGLTLSGGNLELTDTSVPSLITSLTQSGSSLIPDPGVSLTLAGTSTWLAGTWTGTGGGVGTVTVGSGAVLNIAANNTVQMDQGAAMVVLGTVNWTSGTLCLSNGASIQNGSPTQAGTFNITVDNATLGAVCNKGGPDDFTNQAKGTVVRDGAPLQATTIDSFTNLGTVDAQSGDLKLSGSTSAGTPDTGTINTDPGATVELSAGNRQFAPGAVTTGSGTLELDGASLSGTVAFDGTTEWSAGTMSGTGTATVGQGGSFNLGGKVDLDSGYTLVNDGTLDWDGSHPLCVTNGSAVTNNATFNIRAGQTLGGSDCFPKGGSGTVTNSATGTITTVGPGTTTVDINFNNDGAVTAQASTLELAGGNTAPDTGSFTASGSGAAFHVTNGGRTEGAGATFAGLWHVSGGNVTYTGNSLPDAVQDGGTTSGSFTVPAGGTYEWSAGLIQGGASPASATVAPNGTFNVDAGGGKVDLDNGATLHVLGTVNWNSGTFCLTNGASIQNGSPTQPGIFNIAADGSLLGPVAACFPLGGNADFTNQAQGVVVGQDSGANPTAIETTFDNSGTVVGSSGDLQLAASNDTPDTGTIVTQPGATVELNAGGRQFASGATTSGPGDLKLDGASITGSVAFDGTTDWSTGIMSGGGTATVGPAGTFNVTGQVDLDNGYTLLNQGTLNWTGAKPLCVTNGSAVTNTGVFNLVTGQTLGGGDCYPKGGSGQVTNTRGATLTASGPGATATFAIPLTNDGTVTVESGTLAAAGGLTNWDGASQTLTGGAYDLLGTFSFPGADVLHNASSITLDGASSALADQSGTEGLRDLASNAASGSLTLGGGRALTTSGALSNAGAVSIGTGSSLTTTGNYTQTSGSTSLTSAMAALTAKGGHVTIQGGTLDGLGTVTPDATNSGIVSPGLSPGILTVAGPFTQTSGGEFDVEIGGTSPGTGYDQLIVNGTATLDGTLSISTISPFTPALGSSFKIMQYTDHGSTTFPTVHGAVISRTLFYARQYDPTDLTLVTEDRIGVSGKSLTPAEGAAFNGTVATFTDNEDPSTDFTAYTAQIDWGDGSAPSSGTVTYDASSGHFVVTGSHTYTEQGPYTTTVTVSDTADNALGSGQGSAAVSDPPVSATPGAWSSTEGAAPTAQALATFTDPGGPEPVSNYTATIDWGDGTTSPGTITASGSKFQVSGTHAYAEEGAPVIAVTLHHASASPDQVIKLAGSVADAALSSSGTSITATKGSPFTGTVASFTDSDPAAAATDYTATINWGDGTAPSTGTVSHTANGFTVAGSHTYAGSGSFTGSVTINDAGGSHTVATTTAKVSAPAPSNTLTMIKARRVGQAIQIVVAVPGPGALQAAAATMQRRGKKTTTTVLGRARGSVIKAGVAKLKLTLSPRVRGILRRHKHLTVQIVITYTPTGGTPNQKTLRLRL